MSENGPVIIPDDLYTIPMVAKLAKRAYSSVYGPIRKGKITLYFISGDSEAKVSLSEVKNHFAVVRTNFSAPTFRIVRIDDKPPVDEPLKENLFA
jgi:hypothetical protein